MIGMEHNKRSEAEHAQSLHDVAMTNYRILCEKYERTPQCTVGDAIRHFNNGGSVVVRARGHNVLYAKRWHTEAVLTSAIQESDSFNCVGEILC